ncbi:hypothetical protein ACK6D9_19090 [Hoeflea sp. Naph1]
MSYEFASPLQFDRSDRLPLTLKHRHPGAGRLAVIGCRSLLLQVAAWWA